VLTTSLLRVRHYFLVYGTQRGTLHYYYLQDRISVNEYRHEVGRYNLKQVETRVECSLFQRLKITCANKYSVSRLPIHSLGHSRTHDLTNSRTHELTNSRTSKLFSCCAVNSNLRRYNEDGAIRSISLNSLGTRLVFIDSRSVPSFFNPVNDQVLDIPDFQAGRSLRSPDQSETLSLW